MFTSPNLTNILSREWKKKHHSKMLRKTKLPPSFIVQRRPIADSLT